MIEAFVIVNAVLTLAVLGLLFARRGGSGDGAALQRLASVEKELERFERAVREDLGQSRREQEATAKQLREEVTGLISKLGTTTTEVLKNGTTDQKSRLEDFGKQIAEEKAANVKKIDELRQTIENKLEHLRGDHTKNAEATRAESSKSLREFTTQLREHLNDSFKTQNETLLTMSRRLSELIETSDKRGETLRTTVEKRLDTLREDNNKKLEAMRNTVDEKLQGTLEKRLGESFKQVSERLETVHKGLGEMKNLANGVGDLKRVMTNVKSRGTWGEVQLGAILEHILSPTQFERNVKVKPTSSEHVEYAVCLPREGGGPNEMVYLPIDSKFPVEAYQRLLQAQEDADSTTVLSEGRALENGIKQCAADIQNKYLAPPHTTDFGIMFLPSEGLYAEAIRRTSLVEFCQREHRVVLAGPTTLAAILNSFQLGFRTMAIQERSTEVWEVLGAVKNEFGKFGDVLTKVKKKLQQASNSVEEAERRNRVMNRHLRAVEELPADKVQNMLRFDDALSTDDDAEEITTNADADGTED